MELMEQEHGNPDELKQRMSKIASIAVGDAVQELGPFGNAAAIVAETVGLLDTIGDALGSAIAGIFSDDRIDGKDFIISNDYFKKLVSDPNSLERRSKAIHDISFNWPPPPGQPDGRDEEGDFSWLFSGGGGSYRVFFRVKVV
jgi:hypothetical protein